jgi:hypothetical protein
MPFGNCEVLERVGKYKYLGVFIDHRLSWIPHMEYLKCRVRKLIYAFKQLKEVLPIYQLRMIYFAYVQSILTYGILAWGGASSYALRAVGVAQRAIIKTCLGRDSRYPTELAYQEFQVLDVRQLYIKTLLIFIRGNKGSIFNPLNHHYHTRNINRYGIFQPRLVSNCNRFNSHYICHILYRNIPNFIKDIEPLSLHTFKRNLVIWLFAIGRDAADQLICSAYRF